MVKLSRKKLQKILLLYKTQKVKLAKWILYTILHKSLYFVSTPIALIILFIKPIVKIRFIGLQSYRIGHYSLNTELMLCALDLQNINEKKFKTIFFNMSKPCNTQLCQMWKRVIPIFRFHLLAIQIDKILSTIYGKTYKNEIKNIYENCGSGAVDSSGLLEKINKPHLFFTPKEKENAKKLMTQLGIPSDAKFVCLVVRDSAYLNREYPENDWSYHDHRNADISSYKKAALYLAEKGYYVLRLGKYVEKKFDVTHPKVIDYANHPLRCDFMDVYLSANCEFFISSCTGLDCVAQIFRRPVLLTNISPVFTETLMWYPCTLFIPKTLKNKNTHELLPFSETAKIIHSISKPILHELDKSDLKMVENNEEEILEVVKEMEERVTGNWQGSFNDTSLQNEYWENHKKYAPIYVDKICIKIGSDFLRNNDIFLR